jgi:hypothetical protein
MLDKDHGAKALAVKKMIDLLDSEKPPVFQVLLLRYYIDNKPYECSMLTVTPDYTPNIHQTETGFECDAFFPPDRLEEHAKTGKEAVHGGIKVKMRVDMKDVVAIVGKEAGGKGPEIKLYVRK